MYSNNNDLAARFSQLRVWILWLGILFPAMIGCQRNSDEAATIATEYSDQTSATATDAEDATPAESTATEKAVEVKVEVQFASWEDVQKIAESTGKVTVLDIWSTVCGPCIQELPGLVELHQKLGDKVQCMTLDIDFDGRKSKPPSTYEKDVLSLLTDLGASFPNYVCTTASDDVYAAAEIDSIPAVLVFDANGKLVKKFVDAGESVGFGYHDDVIPFVESMLQK